jgi:xanthine dehydrogenase accessory factor
VGYLDDRPLLAPMAGILRGLCHDGVPVEAGTKVIEVDPRADPTHVFGLGERPGRIADGVLKAVSEWLNRLEVPSAT